MQVLPVLPVELINHRAVLSLAIMSQPGGLLTVKAIVAPNRLIGLGGVELSWFVKLITSVLPLGNVILWLAIISS